MHEKAAATFSDEVWKGIRKRVLLPVMLIYAAFVAIIVLSYIFSIIVTSEHELKVVSHRYSGIVTEYENQIKDITESPGILGVIYGTSYCNGLAEEIYDFMNNQRIGADFFLLDGDGNLLVGSSTFLSSYLTGEHPLQTGFLSLLKANPMKAIRLINQVGNARANGNVLSIGQAVLDGDRVVGFFIFELNPNEILEHVSDAEIGDIVVTNSFYTTLLSSKNEYVDNYSKLKSAYRVKSGFHSCYSQRCLIISSFNSGMDAWFFVIVQLGMYSQYIFGTSLLVFVVFVISMFVIAVTNKRFVSEETESIDALVSRIQKMKQQGLHSAVEPVKSCFVSLETSFNQLLSDIRELASANQQETAMRQRAEIRQLESQFNPHFLFNSLEIIRCYIKVDPLTANKMIIKLSLMLRYSLDTSQQLVSVDDDVQYVESYLSLIKMARPSSINYSITVYEAAKSARIPKLCIQPIVENSIKYSNPDDLTAIDIKIGTSESGDALEIAISDNGPGIEEQKIDEIRKTLDSQSDPEKYSGLYNINRRLKLIYGEDYGIGIESGPGGTIVSMRLPLERSCTQS